MVLLRSITEHVNTVMNGHSTILSRVCRWFM